AWARAPWRGWEMSPTGRATRPVRPARRPRATVFGAYFRSATAARTRWRVPGETRSGSLSTRETVVRETPARRATSRIVAAASPLLIMGQLSPGGGELAAPLLGAVSQAELARGCDRLPQRRRARGTEGEAGAERAGECAPRTGGIHGVDRGGRGGEVAPAGAVPAEGEADPVGGNRGGQIGGFELVDEDDVGEGQHLIQARAPGGGVDDQRRPGLLRPRRRRPQHVIAKLELQRDDVAGAKGDRRKLIRRYRAVGPVGDDDGVVPLHVHDDRGRAGC